MPLGFFILPFMLLILAGFLFLAFYLGKYKFISQRKFFIAYWGMLVVLEILFIYVFVDGVQFIPPSFFVSYTYGTVFLILYVIQCLSANNPLSAKLKYIGSSIALNYLVIPATLILIL